MNPSLRKSVLLLLPAVSLALMAGSADASWFGVQWGSPTRGISVWLSNYDKNNDTNFTQAGDAFTANIAPASGRAGATSAAVTTGVGATTYSPVFCVDILRTANSGYSAYEVDQHTGVDGTAGWTTPSGDNDELRSNAGLGHSAWLANNFGGSWNTDTNAVVNGGSPSDIAARKIALNVAIWKAAYGSAFNYISGLNATEKVYYDYYVTFIGNSSSDYTWWDSKVGDVSSTHQDFITAVPEPSSLLLLGSVLALGSGLVAVRRRKRSV